MEPTGSRSKLHVRSAGAGPGNRVPEWPISWLRDPGASASHAVQAVLANTAHFWRFAEARDREKERAHLSCAPQSQPSGTDRRLSLVNGAWREHSVGIGAFRGALLGEPRLQHGQDHSGI